MDWTDLKAYVDSGADEDAYVESCWNDARLLLTTATASAFREIPASIFDRWSLEVGNELYNRKATPSGGADYMAFEGGSSIPVRGPRDPLRQVRPMLAMYVVAF